MYTTAYLTACTALAVACFYMIFARCYPDGIIGKLALLPVWLASSVVVVRLILLEEQPQVSGSAVWIVAGMSVFILRHLHRFVHHQRSDPRPPNYCPKRRTS